MFDGVVWMPVVAGMKGVALSHVTASRDTHRRPSRQARWGSSGRFFINVGGWTSGPTLIGGSGYELIVPADGNYLVRNRTYFNPGAGSPSGRLNITLDGGTTSNFVQPPPHAAGALTQECTTVHSLIEGQRHRLQSSIWRSRRSITPPPIPRSRSSPSINGRRRERLPGRPSRAALRQREASCVFDGFTWRSVPRCDGRDAWRGGSMATRLPVGAA